MSDLRVTAERARFRLLGVFGLDAPNGDSVFLTSRRGRGLLAHLYLAHEQTAARGQLCGLLWSDRGEAQARASLRQCLLSLRLELGRSGVDCLDVGRERIALRSSEVGSDVAELRRALDDDDIVALVADVRRIGRARLLEDLELPGLFGDWLSQSRSEFDGSFAGRMQTRLKQLEAAGRWKDVRALAEAYLVRDPLDELVVASAIRGDIALGAPSIANRRFQSLKLALAREYGAEPGTAVAEAIASASARSTDDDAPGSVGSPMPAPKAAAESPEPRSVLLGGGRPTVGVLSFTHPPGASEQAYLAQGIAEDIAIALGKFRWLFVLSPRSSLTYDGGDANLPKIRTDLGVRYVVHGKMDSRAGRLRLNATLSDCILGDAVWSHRFEGPMADVFAMTDEIVAVLVGALEPALLRREEDVARKSEPRDLKLWDLFICGRWHFWRLTRRHVGEAQSLLVKALAMAPDDAQVLSLLAFTHIIQLWSGWSDAGETLKEARALAMRAVRVGPTDAFAHYALGTALSLTGDLDGAMEEQRAALEINPNLAGAMGELGRYHAFSGDYDRAVVLFDRAIRTSPNDAQMFLWLRHKAVAAFTTGRLDEALACARAAVSTRTDVSFNHYLLASILAVRGDLNEARAAFAEARRLLPSYPMSVLIFSNPFRRPEDMARYVDALTLCGWEDQ